MKENKDTQRKITEYNKVYLKAGRGEFISASDIASLCRSALKKQFPSVKFSIRSKYYAGGCSVDLSWMDGPTKEKVDQIINMFSTKGFDGSIDLAYSKSLWLYPDGSASVARDEGTQSSGGYHPEVIRSAKKTGGILVEEIASCWVMTQRSLSASLLEKGIEAVKAQNWAVLDGVDWSKVTIQTGNFGSWISYAPNIWVYNSYLSDTIHNEARQLEGV